MPVVNTKGAASSQGFGEFAKTGSATYIEDVFSTYLYTGNGTTNNIVNGIDLSGKGGLVWFKSRSYSNQHALFDTARGNSSVIASDLVYAANYFGTPNVLTSFNSNGFSLGQDNYGWTNSLGFPQVSWTFRKQPKFFDIVTYTGTGSATTIAHSLASTPGCIIVKRTDTTANWQVYHVGFGSPTVSAQLNLFATPAAAATVWNSTAPTSSVFSVGTSTDVNASGGTYVAYLFANNAGGFGLTGTDNVITCGMVTGAGSTTYVPINLGYEPQWLLTKKNGSSSGWVLWDIMRGWVSTINLNASLSANTSDITDPGQWQPGSPSATGINFLGSSGEEYSYIAIRRGPMKTPTTGTSVFSPIAATNSTSTKNTTNFPVDLQFAANYSSSNAIFTMDRLRGVVTTNTDATSPYLITRTTDAEASDITGLTRYWDNTGFMTASNQSGLDNIYWNFGRAPGFFDEVCYTGTGTSGQTYNHNLGVAPELIIFKERSAASSLGWPTVFGFSSTTVTFQGLLNNTGATYQSSNVTYTSSSFIKAQPTSTLITIGDYSDINSSGQTYVAYLFATCAGVSKVGSYTGTGTLTTIDCGFTGGARFVMIKKTSGTSNWFVWDTARGMVSGTDPSLNFNNSNAQSNANSVYTATTGFQLLASPSADVNTSGGTYIYLAIA